MTHNSIVQTHSTEEKTVGWALPTKDNLKYNQPILFNNKGEVGVHYLNPLFP